MRVTYFISGQVKQGPAIGLGCVTGWCLVLWVCLCLFLTLSISETAGDKGLVIIGFWKPIGRAGRIDWWRHWWRHVNGEPMTSKRERTHSMKSDLLSSSDDRWSKSHIETKWTRLMVEEIHHKTRTIGFENHSDFQYEEEIWVWIMLTPTDYSPARNTF